jgi:hypothetical protein
MKAIACLAAFTTIAMLETAVAQIKTQSGRPAHVTNVADTTQRKMHSTVGNGVASRKSSEGD